jgi:simple sugar transport system ATP-binding protein
MQAALSLEGIDKHFGSVHALRQASITVRPSTIHAVLGENGAGKSTLMRVAYGMVVPDAGAIAVQGRAVTFRSPRDAVRAGIGMVHQHFSNVPAMTVAENVALGNRGLYRPQVARARVEQVAHGAGLPLEPSARVADLPIGAQQRLEIVKALAGNARLLILDEPTAVLAPSEAADLLAWLRRYAAAGNAVVLVTHKVREALQLADDITVLRQGAVVARGDAASFTAESLAAAMFPSMPQALPELGASDVAHPSTNVQAGTTVVRARGLKVRNTAGRVRVQDATFDLRAGEIVGIAGIEGAGHAELLRALAGVLPVDAGSLELPEAVGFVPEDRHRDAMVLDFSLPENLALRGAGTRRGVMRWDAWHRAASELIRAFDVRTGAVDAAARTLSGGNQQKFVLGRELSSAPKLLIAENPTRGLDLQATAAVRERLRAAARAGVAVVAYSSDLDEVLELASRVLVVHQGHVREVAPDRDLVGRAMLGAA